MRPHDRALLDALEALAPVRFAGEVWRIARAGRAALAGSAAPGRWTSPVEPEARVAPEVLYTSFAREGALAEIGYRLSLEPVWPSRVAHELHRIGATTERSLEFADVAALAPLGVEPTRYAGFDYAATQAIAVAAHFLEFDGLLVPSARAACQNLVLFLDRAATANRLEVLASEAVDWAAWRTRSAQGRAG
jgi:hypothetical protein